MFGLAYSTWLDFICISKFILMIKYEKKNISIIQFERYQTKGLTTKGFDKITKMNNR